MPTVTESVAVSQPHLPIQAADDVVGLYPKVLVAAPRYALALYHHRATDGKSLDDFSARPWWIQPYLDESNQIILKKASQIGATEFMLCEMFALSIHGVPGLYILPTDRWRNEFVANRVDKLINRVPFYAANCESVGTHKKDIQARGMKTLFGATWKFAGSNQVRNFFEIPVGALIIDENDQCDQANLVYARDRLGAAKRPIIRILGNPTIGGSGIDAKFGESDKKYWWTKCDKCGEYQRLDWFIHFIEQGEGGKCRLRDARTDGDASPICSHCHEPFNRCGAGEWRADNPVSKISGYQLSRLFADSRMDIDVVRGLFAEWVAAQSNMTALQRFYNNILGETFEASGVKLTDATLAACVDPAWLPRAKDGARVAGVDIGTGLHTIIYEIRSGKLYQIAVALCSDYSDLSSLCENLGVTTGVMDAGPEIHAPREFVRGRAGWFLCRYNLSDKLVAGKKTTHKDMHVDWVEKAVSVNRTESLDGHFADWQNGVFILPATYQAIDNGDFVRQMKMPTRIREDRPDGTFRYIWTKGDDHYHHASNYARIAARIYNSGSMIVAG